MRYTKPGDVIRNRTQLQLSLWLLTGVLSGCGSHDIVVLDPQAKKTYTLRVRVREGDTFPFRIHVWNDGPERADSMFNALRSYTIDATMRVTQVSQNKISVISNVDKLTGGTGPEAADRARRLGTGRKSKTVNEFGQMQLGQGEGDTFTTPFITFPSAPIRIGDHWVGYENCDLGVSRGRFTLVREELMSGKESVLLDYAPEPNQSSWPVLNMQVWIELETGIILKCTRLSRLASTPTEIKMGADISRK